MRTKHQRQAFSQTMRSRFALASKLKHRAAVGRRLQMPTDKAELRTILDVAVQEFRKPPQTDR